MEEEKKATKSTVVTVSISPELFSFWRDKISPTEFSDFVLNASVNELWCIDNALLSYLGKEPIEGLPKVHAWMPEVSEKTEVFIRLSRYDNAEILKLDQIVREIYENKLQRTFENFIWETQPGDKELDIIIESSSRLSKFFQHKDNFYFLVWKTISGFVKGFKEAAASKNKIRTVD